MTRRHASVLYAAALALGALPLWAGTELPLVDLPQHLHLISVLHRLHDPSTLYPQVFALRGELTPYLGYYYVVDLLSWLFPLGVANKLFLTAYVLGMPLALGFLLRSLGRPRWPSLLALPFAYGDSLNWGFINYCAALPLTFLSCGLFVRALTDAARRRTWALWHAGVLVAVLLFHVQAFGFLAVALPFLLLTTPVAGAPLEGPAWRRLLVPRAWALLSVLPGVLLFLVWVVARLGAPAEVEAGVPWKAWGPMLSPQNLSYLSFARNREAFFEVLANTLRDGSDRAALWAVGGVVALAVLARAWAWAGSAPPREGPLARWRLPGLAALALLLYFTLPFDIRGYMYYLNLRFAHLAAALLVASVPVLGARARRPLLVLGAAAALVLAVPLARGVAAFNREAAALLSLSDVTPERPRIMALVFDPQSDVVTHPVFLHAGAVLARLHGGITNFSFATTPHSPIRYATAPPPTFPSEWNPRGFRWDTMGPAYDTFLVVGPTPEAVFGSLLGGELTVAGQQGRFALVRRR